MKWKYPDYLPKPPHNMNSSDWQAYLGGLTKFEKQARYGSVETSLIPAVELIEAQGLGDINPDPYEKSALELDTSPGATTVGSLNGFLDFSTAAQ